MGTYAVDIGDATYEVDAPDENTAWKRANAQHSAKPEAVTNPTIGERVAGTDLARAGMGAAAIPIATVQAGMNIGDWLSDKLGISGSLGKTKYVNMADAPKDQHEAIIANNMRGLEPTFNVNQSLKDLEAAKRRGMSFYSRNPVGEDWDVAGGLGTVAGGLLALKAAALPERATKVGRYLQGGAAGGLLASLMPDTAADSPEEYASNLAGRAKIGAVMGTVFPLATDVTKGVYNLGKSSVGALSDTFKNFSPKGQLQLAENHLRTLADYGGREKTLASLRAADKLTGNPTSAEAIAQANIGAGGRFGGPLVRLQSELASLPETTTKLRGIEAAQEAARLSSLGRITGTSEQQAAALAAAEKAGAAYKAIEGNLVDAKRNSTFKWIARSDAFKAAMREAQKTLTNKNAAAGANGESVIPLVDEAGRYSAGGLQLVKEALDKASESPTVASQMGFKGTNTAHIRAVKNALVKFMDNNIEGWKQAREGYKSAMTVLNRQRGGDVLQKSLSGPRGEERVASFLQAQIDLPKTLKPALGKIRPVPFTAEEMGIIDDVASQLRRDAQVTRMAGELNIPGATSPVTGNMAQLPSPLYRPTMIANWILRRGGDEGNRQVNRIAADILADPQRAAEVLGKLPSPTRKAVMDVMTRIGKEAYTAGFAGATTLPAKDAQQWLPE